MMLFHPLQLLEKQAIPASPPPPQTSFFSFLRLPQTLSLDHHSIHELHPQRVKIITAVSPPATGRLCLRQWELSKPLFCLGCILLGLCLFCFVMQ